MLRYGYSFEGYKGLLSVYSTRGLVDSVRKYAPLYLQSVDEANAKLRTDAVLNICSLYLPDFYLEIRDAYGLSPLELQTTLLLCLGISNADMLYILGKSSQHITNTKKSANQKIFNDGKASSLRRNLMQKLGCF